MEAVNFESTEKTISMIEEKHSSVFNAKTFEAIKGFKASLLLKTNFKKKLVVRCVSEFQTGHPL